MDIKQLKDLNQGDIFTFQEGKLKEELFIIPEDSICKGWDNSFKVISIKTGGTIRFKDNSIIKIIKYNTSNINTLEIIADSRLSLVKAIKELTGLGLKESKDYMDEFQQEIKKSDETISYKLYLNNVDYIKYIRYENDNVTINKL